MNPISRRPHTWSQVVGQVRAVRLLQSVLKYGKLIPRGFILSGPYGTGKTTTAYLMARGLMCLNSGSIGGDQCNSCKIIDSQGLEGPNVTDFREIDAASHSGVEATRQIASPEGFGEAPPALSRRRVTLIDEAQRLSSAAWDVYLKPLEQARDYSVYIFSTTNVEAVPETIRSRCIKVPFNKVAEADIVGLLTTTAVRESLRYELGALKLIAKRSDGAPRNAILSLAQVAALGTVSTENVELVVDTTLENKCGQIWVYAMEKNQAAAAKVAEDLGLHFNPNVVIEKLCTQYSDALRSPETKLQENIRENYADIVSTTTFFLKWLAVPHLPPDALQLFAYELMYLRERIAPAARIIEKPKPVGAAEIFAE